MFYYHRTTKQTHAIDIRETAPGQATENMFSDKISSRIGKYNF